MKLYRAKDIEEKWIREWDRRDEFKFKDDGNEKKLYILDMFPYPSGSGLHVGHLKGYLATDIWARYSIMKGYTVFHPMGWDAFGLPAEQYAIKTGNSPEIFTNQNIGNFRNQLKRLMLSYDFSREINTSDPEYYKYTQWIFSEMYRDGLAELKDTQVNWCEELNTVLSDEEIIEGENGKRYSERGNYEVVSKIMKQWVLKITDYSEELLEDLKLLDWPDNVKKIQENWIGKDFRYIYNFKFKDTVYPLYLKYASSIRKLRAIGIHEFSKLSSILDLSRLNCGNKELLPVKLVSDFWHTKKGSSLKIDSRLKKSFNLCFLWNADFRSDDLVPIFSSGEKEDDFYDQEIEDWYLREYEVKAIPSYKLKDWVFSRQRYWGEPIPVLYDESGNIFLDEDLPVVLPKKVDYLIKRNGLSPLSNDKKWLNVRKNSKDFVRETNTMPNWAGSSWYFIAYLLKKCDGTYYDLNSNEAKEILKRWLPVDIYIGGQEHAAMHLLYARFWHKFLYKKGIVFTKEPFKALFNQGLVLGSDGSKMSKSKGNYVGIDEIIKNYGSDALRVYEAFSGPTQLSFKWGDDGIKGSQKWLNKVYVFFNNIDNLQNIEQDREVSKLENNLIQALEKSIPSLKINLGVSELMIFMNEIQKLGKYNNKALNSFVQILSFYAPALAEELWTTILGNKGSLFKSKWPELNNVEKIHGLEYKVFINGKFKFLIEISRFEVDSDDYLITLVISKLSERKENLIIEDVHVNHEKKIILVKAKVEQS